MDHETATKPTHLWLHDLQVAEVLAAFTGALTILVCFLNG